MILSTRVKINLEVYLALQVLSTNIVPRYVGIVKETVMLEHHEGIPCRKEKKSPLVRRIVLYLMLIMVSFFVVYAFFIRFYSQKEEYCALGKKVFAERCVSCHGADARGLIGPDLTRKDFTYGKTEATLIKTITMGRPGGMPAFADNLSREQIKCLAQFLLSL